jgi:hypothetical protein
VKFLLKRFGILMVVLVFSFRLCGQSGPVELGLDSKLPFSFVALGDTRFTDPANTDASNDFVRLELVKAIAHIQPEFISIGGDLVYNGYDAHDWKIWDLETAPWREKQIPVYPALGNHDLNGDPRLALTNFFEKFPYLQGSRYYSVRAANILMLVLDSSQEETSGGQGRWLKQKLDTVSTDTDFVFIVLHHPPLTASSNRAILRGGGHSVRRREQQLAKLLEIRQAHLRARIIVLASHVHNYEHYEHGGITYIVTGGGGAHPYLIPRKNDDPLRGLEVNYHYLLVEVKSNFVKITMNRLEQDGAKAKWSRPDEVTVGATR